MTGNRRWPILLLIVMSLVGIGLGIWLFRAGEILLGCIEIGLWLWMAQRFAIFLIVPGAVPSNVALPVRSLWQRILLAIVCLLGAAICAVGVYLWYWWPEEWHAGFVFVLFGFLVLAPVTVKEVRIRKKLRA